MDGAMLHSTLQNKTQNQTQWMINLRQGISNIYAK